MKRLLLFSALVLSLQVMAQKPYSINGTIVGDTPEEWIYIDKFMGNGEEYDSTRILGGKFTFSGVVTTPELYTIFFDNSRRETRRHGMVRVFVEPLQVDLILNMSDMYNKSSVTSGNVNTDFFKIEKHLTNNYRNPIDSLAKLAAVANPDRRDDIIDDMESYQAKMTKYCRDYVKKNPESPISLVLLMQFYNTLSDEEKQIIKSHFPDNIKQTLLFKII